jgi:hypothetical protein
LLALRIWHLFGDHGHFEWDGAKVFAAIMSAPAYSPPTNSSPMRHHIRWQQASDHSVSDPVCERRFADQLGEAPC